VNSSEDRDIEPLMLDWHLFL